MKKLIIAGLAVVMCMSVFSGNAMSADKKSDRKADFGARLGYIDCSGCSGAFQLGVDYFMPVMEKDDLDIRLNFSDGNIFNIRSLSGNYIYNMPVKNGTGGFVGAGLGINRFSKNVYGINENLTKIGINLLGGYKFTENVSAEIMYSSIDSHNFYGLNLGYRFKKVR